MRLPGAGPAGRVVACCLLLAVALTGCLPPGPDRPGPAQARDAATHRSTAGATRAREAFGSLPLLFVENHGQTDPRVTHYVQGGAASVFFTPQAITHLLRAPADDVPATSESATLTTNGGLHTTHAEPRRWQHRAVEVELVGAAPGLQPRGTMTAPTLVSYFKGQETDWQTGLPTSTGIVYPELWPGIDLVYESAVGRLKSSFVVRPGADPRRIVLAYRGATAVGLDEAGDLTVSTPIGGFRETAPVAYQDRDGERTVVGAGFRVEAAPDLDASVVSFDVGAYDPEQTLVIDPTVLYNRPLGDVYTDGASGLAVDVAGNAYVTGITEGLPTGVPTVGPDTGWNGDLDAFVGKLNPSGSAWVYLGFIGSDGSDQAEEIAVDGSNRAYVVGETDASPAATARPNGFPVKVGPDLTYGGATDAWVARVNAAGTGLDYAGYIGGAGTESAVGVTTDGAGNAYVVGITTSTRGNGFPSKTGPSINSFGRQDGFIAKVSSDGSSFVYAGFVGTTSDDFLNDVVVDGAGNAYVVGGSKGRIAGRTDTEVMLAKVKPAGDALEYTRSWGGTKDDIGNSIAIDGAGNLYVAGDTNSVDYPRTIGPTSGGQIDAFLTKLVPNGSSFVYSRFIGGSGDDRAVAVALDGATNAYVAGVTSSSQDQGFPVVGGPDLTYQGDFDGFLVKILPDGSGPSLGTYVEGDPAAARSVLQGLGLDASGNMYVAGFFLVDPFNPIVDFQTFIAKLGESSVPPSIACSPRPPVRVTTARAASGQLLVTIAAGTSAGAPTNGLRELRFGTTRNALIDINGGPAGLTGPYTHTLTAHPAQTTFIVRRAGTGAFTVPLDVLDDCSTPWRTFVGGGANVP